MSCTPTLNTGRMPINKINMVNIEIIVNKEETTSVETERW
jgi:hypothetical protein